MPAILWTRYFLDAQGYPLKPSKINQDNLSAKLLETNRRGSSSKRTCHMKIRYFFAADVQQRKHITLEYFPTNEMNGDFFTNPLGGAKFRRLRNIIMNISHDELGPVNGEELVVIHQEKIQWRMNVKGEYDNSPHESTVNTGLKVSKTVDSQECVGDCVNRSNSSWATVRAAHKYTRGRNRRPTYAEVVAE
mmetsp:Transcript_28930/g.61429  ORF Transcript_28930/g.61429 Transcript_28930/m.61429 type:complete len:191 (-) Transcript_28930:49-621(-)